MCVMDKEGKSNQMAKEPDFVLQWGSSKRHRCPPKVKSRDDKKRNSGNGGGSRIPNEGCGGGSNLSLSSSDSPARRKVAPSSAGNSRKERSPLRSLHRSSEGAMNKRKSSQAALEEDRIYTTRGSTGGEETGKVLLESNSKNDKGELIWPKLFLSLSSKEKEEDFMAMKGCKPSQRPKKRGKLIQRSVFLVSPGSWLSDLTQDRYEVKEKKAAKKKPRGLKAMGGMESDSE
ncbi:hypothetical protein MLD38_025409 [Melastoma candidum]|uniref:Uncharacterized protein n=1 Tax=Melastoma candidum TaxID=119954 RepID=A0ACB9NW86_9MYRT|nr:hypothetical protein MLD38_025409 [Melastoma candidum]